MKCRAHPKYKALRRPRVLCEQCWAMWLARIKVLWNYDEVKSLIDRIPIPE